MGVPQQVEEAATLAEDYINGLNEATDETADTEEASEESSETEETDDVEEPEGEEETDKKPEEEDFKAKYNTLKGKYDAEVPRLHDELKDLKSSIFEKLEKISEESAEEPQSDTGEETQENKLLDAFREEYGDDLLKYLDAYFESKLPEVKQDVSDSVKTVEEKVTSMEETQIETAREEFASKLDDSINGDWRAAWQGEDPKFTEFLNQPDPSGLYTNGELVDLYSQNWDAVKMATLLNQYYGEPEKDKADDPKEEKSSKEKDALVAPSKKSPVTTPKEDGEKKIWTSESIKQFEIDDRKGKYKPEESKALWDDLLLAPSENRIR